MRLGRGQDRLAWMLWLKVRIAVSLRLFEDAPGSGRLSSAATAQTWALAQTIVADHAGSHVGVPEIAVFARIPRCAARANARHETARRMNLELEQATTVRLDVWLWAARFFKTRSLAKNAVETGKVDVAGQRPKPSRTLRSGEQLRIDAVGKSSRSPLLRSALCAARHRSHRRFMSKATARARPARNGACSALPSARAIVRPRVNRTSVRAG